MESPADLSSRSWREVLRALRRSVKEDNVTLMAAGVAFYALLALAPALIALLSVYGLVADPTDVREQVVDALAATPVEVQEMVSSQLESIASGSSGTAVLTVVIGLAVALWSASSGVGNLITAVNVAYDEDDERGFVRRRALALAFTVGAVVFFALAFAALSFLPGLLADAGLGAVGRWAALIASWVVLVVGLGVGLATLYRYGPDRAEPRWQWVSPGALLAIVLWLLGSVVFSLYTANFASYNETYGSLGAVVVTMLWLFITALSILLGAELNAEVERRAPTAVTRARSGADAA